eukprot:7491006-Heterocapsa_arctica.AAC.1
MLGDVVATFVAPFVTQVRNEAKPRVQQGATRWAYTIGFCEKAHRIAHAMLNPLMLQQPFFSFETGMGCRTQHAR